MYDVVGMEVVYGGEDRENNYGGIFLGELSFFTNAIEEFTAGCELCDDIVFVLKGC